jgi:hypothetical protein
MPSLVKLQYFPSPPRGQRVKYEKGWTYVERRPSNRLEICRRKIRSRAPSPEPRPASSRLCIEDHIHLHKHYDSCHYLDEVEPRIIKREPKECRPALPAPPPPPPPLPTSCPILSSRKNDEDKAAKANIAHLSATLIAKQEELDAINRAAREDKRRWERKLLEPSLPPRPWEREWERERERERQMDRAREEMRAELKDRERARQRAREREEFRDREIARLRVIERERERQRQRQRERTGWPRRRSYYDPHHAANVLERSPVRYC